MTKKGPKFKHGDPDTSVLYKRVPTSKKEELIDIIDSYLYGTIKIIRIKPKQTKTNQTK